MRISVIITIIFNLILLSSCNKCKDKTCLNGSTCDKKSADCSNVCNNGGKSDPSTGSCTCPEFYTGSTCSDEIRSNYIGVYVGEVHFENKIYLSAVKVSNFKDNFKLISYEIDITSPISTIANSKFTVTTELVSTTKTSIQEKEVYYSLGEGNAKITGTGTISQKQLQSNLNLEMLDGNNRGKTLILKIMGKKP